MMERIVSCRNYAEELRILAAEKKQIENQWALLQTAETFDRLADAFEALQQAGRGEASREASPIERERRERRHTGS